MMVPKITYSIVFLIVFHWAALGQVKYDFTWALGESRFAADPPFLYPYAIMDYNGGGLNIYTDTLLYGNIDNAMTISDKNTGQMLFYSNHCWIADPENNYLDNGDHLFIDGDYKNYCKREYIAYQINIVLPIHENHFYFIQQFNRLDIDYEHGALTDYLTSSKIIKEHGQWKVKQPLKVVSRDTIASGQMQAVKKEANNGWWLILSGIDFRKLKIYSVDSSGVSLHREQIIGDTMNDYVGSTTGTVFSPNGKWYARYDGDNGLNMYRFDRTDGHFYDYFRIYPRTDVAFGDVAFSPNSRYVYVSTLDTLYQYDLQADDFEESGIVVSSFDPEVDTGALWSNFNRMMIAPDCRIYINRHFGDMRDLHVINQPNRRGEACEVIKQAYKLPVSISWSEPNYPNYRLGTPWEDRCDSILSSTSSPAHVDDEQRQLRIIPNPASHTTKVVLQKELSGPTLLQVFDMHGQLKYHESLDWHRWTRYDLPSHRWRSGLYVVRLQTKSGEVYSGKMIIK